MNMIIYPDTGFNSFISETEADAYFSTRFGGTELLDDASDDLEPLLMTAFRVICELNITLDPDDAAEIQALKNAQCEQAYHESKGLEASSFSSLNLGSLKLVPAKLERYSERALAILRPYISTNTCTITR